MPSPKCANILIVRTDRIGDVVLTTPVFKALRAGYPNARITVLVSESTKDLVLGNPYIDEVLIDARQGEHKGLLGFLKLARLIRFKHFDSVFIFHTKRRYNLACYLAGIPSRIGYKNNKYGMLLTHPLVDERIKGEKHEAQYCLDVLTTVGITQAPTDLFVPLQKEAETWANAWFDQQGLSVGDAIVIHPGASDPTKIWPAASFAKLINALSGRYHSKLILIGGRETVAIAQEIKKQVQHPVVDITGQISLAQMASLLRRSRLLISNDSGPVHVAAGVNTYVISLFLRNQPGINQKRWAPLGEKSFVICNQAGQEVRVDADAKMISGKLDSITVEEVKEQVERIFANDHQSVFYW